MMINDYIKYTYMVIPIFRKKIIVTQNEKNMIK